MSAEFTLPASKATQFMRCGLDFTGLQSLNGSGVATIQIAVADPGCAWQAYNLNGSGFFMVNVLGTGLGTEQLPVTQFKITNNFFGGYSAVTIAVPGSPSVDTLSVRLCVWADNTVKSGSKITMSSSGLSNSGVVCVIKNEDTGDQIVLNSSTQNDDMVFTAA